MGTFFGPLHLLFLAESFADHFVDRRLHKARRDSVAVVIALPIIRSHMPVMHDRRVQLRQRLDQSREPGIRLFEGRDRGLEIVDLAKRFIDLTMPQRPFQAFDLVPYLLTQHRLTLYETFAKLTQYRQLHREMKPVQDMRGLWAHLPLQCPQRVVAIREKGDLLVHLYVLRVQHLIQTPLGLGIQRLNKPKALERGRPVLYTLSKAQHTLADNNLEVMLLVPPIAHVSPVNAHVERAIRQRQELPLTG